MFTNPNLQASARPSVVDCTAVARKLVDNGRRTTTWKPIFWRAGWNRSGTNKHKGMGSREVGATKVYNRFAEGIGRFISVKGDLNVNRLPRHSVLNNFNRRLSYLMLVNKICGVSVM